MPTRSTTKRPPEIQAARNALRRKGWTQKAAAARLGISNVHLCYVLTGRRTSRRVLTAIAALPENPDPA
jgi:transcriptional regulator with XRE-family HTH domain